MHKTCITETPHRRALVGLFTGLLLASVLLLAAQPDQARAVAARQTSEPAITALIDPSPHDGENGWRGTLTHVRLLPRASGSIYYCWDQTVGVWQEARGVLTVPEGKHTLHAMLVGPGGAIGETLHIPFKVEYNTPVRAPDSYKRSRVATGAVTGAATGAVTGAATGAVTGAEVGGGPGVTVHVTVNVHPGAFVQRIGGATRYETGALIAQANTALADTVIIATGATFADALSASGLAGCLDAPILLTQPALLPPAVANQIQSLGAGNVIILGGELAVSSAVEASLSELGLSVRRIGGANRYETAALIGREVMGFGQHGGRVFIARGDDFGDALSLGPLAYSAKAPLLLVRPTAMPAPTRSLLSVSAFSSGCIAGGTAAVSPQVEAEILTFVSMVTRLSGDTRYSTSVAVATWGVGNGLGSYETVGVATGTVFADALCGGAAIGSRGGIILLTRPDALSGEADTTLSAISHVVNEVQVYGGERAVAISVLERIKEILW